MYFSFVNMMCQGVEFCNIGLILPISTSCHVKLLKYSTVDSLNDLLCGFD